MIMPFELHNVEPTKNGNYRFDVYFPGLDITTLDWQLFADGRLICPSVRVGGGLFRAHIHIPEGLRKAIKERVKWYIREKQREVV